MKPTSPKQHILHNFDGKNIKEAVSKPFIGIVIGVALLLGVGTGYAANMFMPGTGTTSEASKDGTKTDESGSKTSAGILDKETFSDTANGVLKEGGFEGEGSFHLDREGGADQNVYLTSSTVDLSEFLEKEVTVWGKTFNAEKAGWLMDVGYIELKK